MRATTILACLVTAGWMVGSLAIGASSASAQSAGHESAAQNVRESQQYEQLLRTNPAFRERRMREECGPITDPQLHQSCLASFGSGATGQDFRRAPASERVR